MIILGVGRPEQMNRFCQQEWVITQQCSNSQSIFSVNKQTTFRDRSGCGLKPISPVICLFELFIFPTLPMSLALLMCVLRYLQSGVKDWFWIWYKHLFVSY